MTPRASFPSWQRLEQHAHELSSLHLNALFAADPKRFQRFSVKVDGLLLDCSKQLVTKETKALLLRLAQEAEVESWRDKMFAGERINRTEDRAVLHTALRAGDDEALRVDGVNIAALLQEQRQRLRSFVERVRSGEWLGYSGKAIRHVVNLGVGGSHLGPQLVTDALEHLSDGRIETHYVCNADGAQFASIAARLDPACTLFIVSSKTFTTTETLTNARLAKQWLQGFLSDPADLAKHFVAVTSAADKAQAFGVAADNIFPMWDFVGGRFSVWSAIGLPIALKLGFKRFEELLAGARSMDRHFREAPLDRNAPVLLALLAVWNASILKRPLHAILPYDQALHLLPSYLQQAEMESNGKSTTWDGEAVDYPTAACLWGGLGINGQHAFFQYLHQGSNVACADFIAALEATGGPRESHEILLANMFAQSEALMRGVSLAEVEAELQGKGLGAAAIAQLAPHKVHAGNRPSTTILLDRIDATHLGALIALYEHKIFVQGVVLRIFSFDQWGVELGKKLAHGIQQELARGALGAGHDSSTAGLIEHYLAARKP